MIRPVLAKLLFFALIPITAFSQEGLYDDLLSYGTPYRKGQLRDLLKTDPDFPERRLYLFGELHGTQANLDLEWEMLQYLHQNRRVNYVLVEMPHSEVFFFQKYIETGDTSLLYEYDGRINKSFLDSLIRYNRSHSGNAISIMGIDMDIQFRNYFYADCISYLARQHHFTDSLSVAGKAIHRLPANRYNSKEMERINEEIKEEIIKDEERFKQAFGKDYPHLKTVVFSLKKDTGVRDDELLENFKRMYAHWFSPSQKPGFLMFIGWSHMFADRRTTFRRLVTADPTSPVGNSICATGIQYVDCYSSQVARNPSRLSHITNDGLIIGNNSSMKKTRTNEALTAIEKLCRESPRSNFLVKLYPQNPLAGWVPDFEPLGMVDLFFIVQQSGPTHALKQ